MGWQIIMISQLIAFLASSALMSVVASVPRNFFKDCSVRVVSFQTDDVSRMYEGEMGIL